MNPLRGSQLMWVQEITLLRSRSTHCLAVLYSWATLSLGAINEETCSCSLGVGQEAKNRRSRPDNGLLHRRRRKRRRRRRRRTMRRRRRRRRGRGGGEREE